eukprot:scaffold2829_cov147-Amphora_coffeaeformis.AAC.7
MVSSHPDWRIKLFGDAILLNGKKSEDPVEKSPQDIEAPASEGPGVEAIPTETMPVQDFFEGYDYIALFFGANYCPFCKKFAPHVVAARPFLESKKCKVIFVSNDRDEANFGASCAKVQGIDVMAYDLTKTAAMRDLFGLKTIPALMILRNAKIQEEQPFVVSNAREILELDPKCENFPWGSVEKKQAAPVTTWERIWIHGRHGNWWHLGHRNVSELRPEDMYMDEHAVRMRAGLLNIITWIAIMNVFHMRDPDLVNVIFGIVTWEFVSSMIFGLTPLSPLGWLGTLMAVVVQPAPLWKPARPKRFAWLIGLTLATTCFILVQYRKELGDSYKPSVAAIALICNTATWLEGNAGFCVGCFLYNNVLVKYGGQQECSECKL